MFTPFTVHDTDAVLGAGPDDSVVLGNGWLSFSACLCNFYAWRAVFYYPSKGKSIHGAPMNDIVFLAVMAGFFIAGGLYVGGCEKL